MRVFIVAAVAVLMLFVAVAVCIAGLPVEPCAEVVFQVEDGIRGEVEAEHLVCAECSVANETIICSCSECTQETAIAHTTGTVLKLPQHVSGDEHSPATDARSRVEVGAVGVRS